MDRQDTKSTDVSEDSIPMNEWISVEDWLPEAGQHVLCYWKLMGPEEMHVLNYWSKEDRWSRQMDDNGWEPPDCWMPLPLPPESRENAVAGHTRGHTG